MGSEICICLFSNVWIRLVQYKNQCFFNAVQRTTDVEGLPAANVCSARSPDHLRLYTGCFNLETNDQQFTRKNVCFERVATNY